MLKLTNKKWKRTDTLAVGLEGFSNSKYKKYPKERLITQETKLGEWVTLDISLTLEDGREDYKKELVTFYLNYESGELNIAVWETSGGFDSISAMNKMLDLGLVEWGDTNE